MRFVALDFETASERPDSACQIGFSVVEDGRIVHEVVELIRPPNLYFSPRCIAVHGIHPSDVLNSPTWDVVWEQHQTILEEYPIIAHNAAFDLNVLCAAMNAYGLTCPYLEYSCSRLIARRAWPGRISYALKAIATELGVEFQHHDALEDARTCAKVVLAAAGEADVQTLEEMEARLGIDRGRVQFGVKIGPKAKSRRANTRARDAATSEIVGKVQSVAPESTIGHMANATEVASSVARSILAACGESKPLAGKSVVLSGRLLGLDHASAIAFLEQLGGQVQPKMNLKTQYVILGTACQASHEPASSQANVDTAQIPSPLSQQQLAELERRNRDGQSIRTLSQRQLLALIPGGSRLARLSIG